MCEGTNFNAFFLRAESNACVWLCTPLKNWILRNQSYSFTWAEVYGMGLSQAEIALFILSVTSVILQIRNTTLKVFAIQWRLSNAQRNSQWTCYSFWNKIILPTPLEVHAAHTIFGYSLLK